jgi:hypothetical protein
MTVTVISDNTGDDYAGTEDTSISNTNPTTNYGTSSTMELTNWAGGSDKHLCLSFSGLSNISASEVVSSVTLGIYRFNGDANTHSIGLKRLLRNWVEAQATWNIYSTGNNWTTGGGESDGNDRSGTSSGSFSSSSVAGYKTITSTGQLMDDVQDFIDGTLTNYGHHVEVLDASNYWAQYRASEGTDGQRPYLSVTHAAAGGLSIPIAAHHYNQNIGSNL